MKNWPVSLKAFTILEMLAGMAIAAGVVLLGFYGLQLAQTQYRLFQKNTDTAQTCRRLETLLWQDFTRSGRVELPGDSTLLCRLGDTRIRYRFTGEAALRAVATPETAFEDTLRVPATLRDTRLDGRPVQQGPVDRCTVQMLPYGEVYECTVWKIYSAEERMSDE